MCFILICNVGTPSKAVTKQRSIETLSPKPASRVAEENRVAPLKRKTRSSTRINRPPKMAKERPSNEMDTDDSEDPVTSPRKKLRPQLPFLNSMNNSTDKLAGTTRHPPSKSSGKARQPISITTTSSNIADESSDDVIVTPRRRLRTRIEPSSKIDSDLSEDVIVEPRRRLRTRIEPLPKLASDLSEDEDIIVTPVTPRRRLRNRIEPSPKIASDSAEEQAADDLREDLKDLRESGGFCGFLHRPIYTLLPLEFFH